MGHSIDLGDGVVTPGGKSREQLAHELTAPARSHRQDGPGHRRLGRVLRLRRGAPRRRPCRGPRPLHVVARHPRPAALLGRLHGEGRRARALPRDRPLASRHAAGQGRLRHRPGDPRQRRRGHRRGLRDVRPRGGGRLGRHAVPGRPLPPARTRSAASPASPG